MLLLEKLLVNKKKFSLIATAGYVGDRLRKRAVYDRWRNIFSNVHLPPNIMLQ